MAESKFEVIFKEAYGYQLRGTIVEWDEALVAWVAADISGFTTKKYKIEKPDRTTITLDDVEFETDGKDGILIATVTSELGIFNQVGWYQIQAILANDTQYFPTAIAGFDVDAPL